MKKFYTLLKSTALFTFLLGFSTSSFSQQSVCGPVVEDFQNTSGSTAGFTGSFALGSSGQRSFLIRRNAIASAIYSITTPTYTLPANATSIGYGFVLDGSEQVDTVAVSIFYRHTVSGQVEEFTLGQFAPIYSQNGQSAEVCFAVSTSNLPGFPAGGSYRFRFEITPNTGSGQANQSVTFDDFRTNGTMSQAPLPVTFLGFEARRVNASVQLSWKVAGEENVARYEVERSSDGRSFQTIASFAPHGKDAYTHTDAATASGTVYYRVKNVDTDGKYKYSTIVRYANGRSDVVLKAFPQPVLNHLTLQHPTISGRALVSLSTADGRVVHSVVPATGSMQTFVNMSSLGKGLYLLRFDGGEGNIQILKILKQ